MYSRISFITSLSLIPLILSIGIIPGISFVDALDEKDAETVCREGQILVFRINSNNYVCVTESTADRWVALGIAERVDLTEEAMQEEAMQEEAMQEEAMQEEAMQEEAMQEEAMMVEGTASLGKHAFGTITSMQDPGIGHESHQLAVLLPPSENIYVGKLTFSASEPVQFVSLTGPIADENIGGQPIWSPDDETHFALTIIDNGLSSGGWYFAGNALALHTMNPTPFSATYSIVYAEVPPGVYSQETVSTGTVHSIQDPGIGHENHSIALILPPREIPYQGGVISYAASENVQLVALMGPLSDDEMLGQPTWTADGETHYALTLIEGSNMGVWNTFSGNALALHTTNPDGFTATYTLAGLH